jgi:hypothetical protein
MSGTVGQFTNVTCEAPVDCQRSESTLARMRRQDRANPEGR